MLRIRKREGSMKREAWRKGNKPASRRISIKYGSLMSVDRSIDPSVKVDCAATKSLYKKGEDLMDLMSIVYSNLTVCQRLCLCLLVRLSVFLTKSIYRRCSTHTFWAAATKRTVIFFLFPPIVLARPSISIRVSVRSSDHPSPSHLISFQCQYRPPSDWLLLAPWKRPS